MKKLLFLTPVLAVTLLTGGCYYPAVVVHPARPAVVVRPAPAVVVHPVRRRAVVVY